MSSMPSLPARRIALMIDCDNVTPDVLPFVLERLRAYGKPLIKRGYGGHATLGCRWKEAMLRDALTPQLHYSAVSGKNTSDIALALDCFELAASGQVDMVCIVTSDADFVYLCTKLRQRQVLCCVIGASQTPAALRAAADVFYEIAPPPAVAKPADVAKLPAVTNSPVTKDMTVAMTMAKSKPTAAPPVNAQVKAAHTLLTKAVAAMLADTGGESIDLAKFGQFLRQHHEQFSYKALGHASLSKMLLSVPKLECRLLGQSFVVALRDG